MLYFLYNFLMNKTLRLATLDDAEKILAIYAKYIKNTTITFEVEVPTLEAFQTRMKNIMSFFPWIVAEIDGEIAGYAYASKHGERAAYGWSADLSVYIDEKFHRHHLGTDLYDELIDLLKKQGFCTVYAAISTPNPKSEAFHQSYGFHKIGEFKNVGHKMNQWLGVTWYDLQISDYVSNPQEPRHYENGQNVSFYRHHLTFA